MVAGRAAGDSASVALATGSRPTVRARSSWVLMHGTSPARVEQHETSAQARWSLNTAPDRLRWPGCTWCRTP
eukprot:1131996-Alexandrium_andersonii.AAC.1